MINTGIKWIGDIPDNWKINRVKDLFYISKDLADDGEPERVLRLARAGIVEKDVTKNEGQMAASYSGYNKVCKFDLLLNPMDLVSGANCNMSEIEGVISPAYINLRRKNSENTNSKFFDYYFKIQYLTFALFAHGKGVSFDNRWTLNADSLLNYKIPVPEIDLQNRIVEKISKDETTIDRLILNQEMQIEKLRKYKNSLILDTIFRGLKKCEYVNPGNQWFGLIPSHWKSSIIGSEFKIRNTKVSDVDYTPLSVTKLPEGIIPQMDQVAKSDAHDDRKLVKKGDFVINSRSDRKMSCGVSNYDGSVSLINIVLEPSGAILPEYCHYLLKNPLFAEEFYKWGHGIVADLWTTNADDLKRISIPVPPKDEQLEIVDYLSDKCKKIESLIAIKQQKIEKLNNYKKSLIYEYVTGKRQVE